VTAFFVLSGFLIASLLLVERSTTGSVDLSPFGGDERGGWYLPRSFSSAW
jgi:hypothetical protein